MDFRTTLPFSQSPFQLHHRQSVLALGSCFAEHIGQRLIDRKFGLTLNPFGILYNPASILGSLRLLEAGRPVERGELFQHQDLWHHFSFHSRFSHPDAPTALEQMNASITEVHRNWEAIDRLILTWGTAYAYRHLGQDEIVANCHKLPGETFERFRLKGESIVETYTEFLSRLKKDKPGLQVLISVSPVRHLRDGLVDNQRSKAVLLLAAETLSQELDFVHYFPAYELVLDDLRDYRFYDRDLAHPNSVAVDYVWDYFRRACFSPEAQAIDARIDPVLRAARHRPFHTDTAAFRKFCTQQLEKIAELEAQFPFIDLSKEKQHFLNG
ncbi:GSCFA domain-containing protein [Flavilitoribacter nigricans]|uniref:GSCFA domain-containing protein n=1 Tax=Flavilitoribacter nigricans TaxID=70997 RepID=UPI0014732ECB|nr:GSCFA domain-containing protein [Flavilitoribacter nigricans]